MPERIRVFGLENETNRQMRHWCCNIDMEFWVFGGRCRLEFWGSDFSLLKGGTGCGRCCGMAFSTWYPSPMGFFRVPFRCLHLFRVLDRGSFEFHFWGFLFIYVLYTLFYFYDYIVLRIWSPIIGGSMLLYLGMLYTVKKIANRKYSYGSQPKKCQNDMFLENRDPIQGFL